MPDTQKWRILIVDDEADICSHLAEVFTAAGFTVSTAEDGLAATMQVDTNPFDVIITDINMPRMNGLQFAENVRCSKLNHKTELFILSAFTGDDVLQKAMALGSVSVLPKPFDTKEAVRLVKDKMKNSTVRTNLDPIIGACFANAAAELTQHYLNKRPLVGKITAWQQPMASSYASGLVAISGTGVDGFLTLSLSRKLLKSLSEALFGSDPHAISESMMADITGEMINQTAGRTQANLARQNIHVTIGLPQVVLGTGHKIFQKGGGSTSRIDFTIDDDAYTLDFNIRYHA